MSRTLFHSMSPQNKKAPPPAEPSNPCSLPLQAALPLGSLKPNLKIASEPLDPNWGSQLTCRKETKKNSESSVNDNPEFHPAQKQLIGQSPHTTRKPWARSALRQ